MDNSSSSEGGGISPETHLAHGFSDPQINCAHHFSHKIPFSFGLFLSSKPCSSIVRPKKPLRTLLLKRTYSLPFIDASNRRDQWLKLTGGEDQLRYHQAEQVYYIKCEDMFGTFDPIIPDVGAKGNEQSSVATHDCFFTTSSSCCFHRDDTIYNESICTNPHCPVLYVPTDFEHKNTYTCCLNFACSCRVADVIMSAHPQITHFPVLIPLCNLFGVIFTHEYEIYACLNGLLKSKTKNLLDETHTKANISAAILRYFSRQLLLQLIDFKGIVHPWLQLLRDLDPFEFSTRTAATGTTTTKGQGTAEESKNAWLLLDWILILFKNMKIWSLIVMMDHALIHGVKIFYHYALFYIGTLFLQLNQNYRPHTVYPAFDTEILIHLLSQIISSESTSLGTRENPMIYKKINVTGKMLKKVGAKFMPFFLGGATLFGEHNKPERTLYGILQTWPSTIILPQEWQILMSWLPSNVRLLSPILAYSSSIHGWNLRTLYLKSENAEPIILLIKTTCSSVFGGFITEALKKRLSLTSGKSFGTGETFVFTLRPKIKKHSWIMAPLNRCNSRSILSTVTSCEHYFDTQALHDIGTIFLPNSPLLSGSALPTTPPTTTYHYHNSEISKTIEQRAADLTVISSHQVNDASSHSLHNNNPSLHSPEKSGPIGLNSQQPPGEKTATNDIFVVATDHDFFIGGGGGNAIWLDDTLVNGCSVHCYTFNNESFVPHELGFFKSACVEVFSFLDPIF